MTTPNEIASATYGRICLQLISVGCRVVPIKEGEFVNGFDVIAPPLPEASWKFLHDMTNGPWPVKPGDALTFYGPKLEIDGPPQMAMALPFHVVVK